MLRTQACVFSTSDAARDDSLAHDSLHTTLFARLFCTLHSLLSVSTLRWIPQAGRCARAHAHTRSTFSFAWRLDGGSAQARGPASLASHQRNLRPARERCASETCCKLYWRGREEVQRVRQGGLESKRRTLSTPIEFCNPRTTGMPGSPCVLSELDPCWHQVTMRQSLPCQNRPRKHKHGPGSSKPRARRIDRAQTDRLQNIGRHAAEGTASSLGVSARGQDTKTTGCKTNNAA